MGYTNLKVYPLQSTLLVPLEDPAIGFNVAINSSPCTCSSMHLSTDRGPLGVYLLQCGLILSQILAKLNKYTLISRIYFFPLNK